MYGTRLRRRPAHPPVWGVSREVSSACVDCCGGDPRDLVARSDPDEHASDGGSGAAGWGRCGA